MKSTAAPRRSEARGGEDVLQWTTESRYQPGGAFTAFISSGRWKWTRPWTWLSRTSWTTSWGAGASTTVTGSTCTDAMQVRTGRLSPLFNWNPRSPPTGVGDHAFWFPPLRCHRWCLQCWDGRPVWAPEANHQQLRVARCRAPEPRAGSYAETHRNWSDWGVRLGASRSPELQLQRERTHQVAPFVLLVGNVEEHRSKRSEETSTARRRSGPHGSACFCLCS